MQKVKITIIGNQNDVSIWGKGIEWGPGVTSELADMTLGEARAMEVEGRNKSTASSPGALDCPWAFGSAELCAEGCK